MCILFGRIPPLILAGEIRWGCLSAAAACDIASNKLCVVGSGSHPFVTCFYFRNFVATPSPGVQEGFNQQDIVISPRVTSLAIPAVSVAA
jgi:hypothetical protein